MTEPTHLAATAPALSVGGIAAAITATVALGSGEHLLARSIAASHPLTLCAIATFGAITMHADPSGKPSMSRSSVRGVAAFRGRQAPPTAAEGFDAMWLQIAHSKGIA